MISRSVGAFSSARWSAASRDPWRCRAGVRTPAEGHVPAQPVEVVVIGIAAADRQHAGAQHIGDRVRDVRGIAPVGNKCGERVRNFAAAIGKREQHHAAIGG
jgi:hypothetical protein